MYASISRGVVYEVEPVGEISFHSKFVSLYTLCFEDPEFKEMVPKLPTFVPAEFCVPYARVVSVFPQTNSPNKDSQKSDRESPQFFARASGLNKERLFKEYHSVWLTSPDHPG
ncbi:hypothetical protein LA6_001437 [Marinibacterium anthonyi]|nr:hypothetical protein LA6_001437 [Marinibacterium anthonyi]